MKNHNFAGTLTTQNIEEVAEKIEATLTGKTYTFVSANEIFGFEPRVRVNQRLKEEDALHVWEDEGCPPKYKGFHFGDSYGVWGLSTSQQENGFDTEYNAPYVVIKWNTITIKHRAPAGHLLYWVIRLQS
jgi:hypothetical protein